MQNFIVLGIIPGTNVQLDFTAWLIISASLLIASLLIHERRNIKWLLTSRYVAFRLNHLKLVSPTKHA